MPFMNSLMGKHGLANKVANRKNMALCRTHLGIDIQKAFVVHFNTSTLCRNSLAIGPATNRLQDKVVALRLSRGLTTFETNINTIGFSLGPNGFASQPNVVEPMLVELLPDLHKVAVRAHHQAVHHLDNINPGTQRGIHGGHL